MKFVKFLLFIATIAAFIYSFSAEAHEIHGRIFNGHQAVAGQFKYVAAVYTRITYGNPQGSACGGALIAPNFVLTAAHCLYNKVEAIIYLGSLDRGDAETNYVIEKMKFVFHPQFNMIPLRNDIALIPIPNTEKCDKIAYARLPHPGTNVHTGDAAIIMGWGRIGDRGQHPTRLHWAVVSIISNEECNLEFGDITDADLCVKTRPPYGSTCSGDSGGPVVLSDTGEVIGVVSSGSTSCEAGKPVIFVRLTIYMPWIMRTTGIHF